MTISVSDASSSTSSDAPREAVTGWTDEHDLVLGERLEADRAVPRRRPDDAELEPPVGDELDHGARVVDLERDPDRRVQPLELAEELRHHDRRRPGRRAERQRACEITGRLGDHVVEELLLEREQLLGAAVEPQTGLRRLDPPARAVEELRAEPLLERAHLERDGGLRDAEQLGGLRERSALDHRAERGQLTRIHKRDAYTDKRNILTYVRYAVMHNAVYAYRDEPVHLRPLALDEAFSNRKREIAALAADMRNGQDVVVLAPRRYGKSSLVLRAAQEVLADDVLVAYCDLMRTPTKVRFAAALAKTIVDDLLSPVQGLLERAGAVVRGLRVRPTVEVDPQRRRRAVLVRGGPGQARTSTRRSSDCSSCPPRSPRSASAASCSCSTSSRRSCGSTTRCRT